MSAITWEIDESGSWELEATHNPTPVTAYHQAIFGEQFPRAFAAGTAQVGILLSHFEPRFVNGFGYVSPRIVGAPAGATKPPPRLLFMLALKLHPEMRRRMRTAATVLDRKPWRDDVKTWESEVKPQSTATHLELQRMRPANLDDAGLADHLRVLHGNAGLSATCTTGSPSAASCRSGTTSPMPASGPACPTPNYCMCVSSVGALRPQPRISSMP
jgi:hypothetical protein